MSDEQAQTPVIYLSFAAADTGVAQELADRLQADGSYRVWRSDDTSGENQPIGDCEAVVVLISRATLGDERVDAELQVAAMKRRPLLPIALSPEVQREAELSTVWGYYLHGAQATLWTTVDDITEQVLDAIIEGDTATSGGQPRKREPGGPALVFLSHSSADRDAAEALANGLRLGGTCEVWLAQEAIRVGRRFAAVIRREMRVCDAVVVLISQAALESVHVSTEVGLCRDEKRPILPVTLDAELRDVRALPDEWVYYLQGIPVIHRAHVATLADVLIGQIAVLSSVESATSVEPATSSVVVPATSSLVELVETPDSAVSVSTDSTNNPRSAVGVSTSTPSDSPFSTSGSAGASHE